MTCSLKQKFGDSRSCDCWDHDAFQGLFVIIIATIIVVCIGYFAYEHHTNYWDNIPIVEREVMAVVIYDESSKCVFVVDGERVRAGASCKFAVGDIVETRSDGSTTYMYNGVYDFGK